MGEGSKAVRFDELRSNWAFLAPCVIGIMLSTMQNYSLGVMTIPLEREFGWSRSEIAGGHFVGAVIALFAAPVAGAAADRFGARYVALPGIILFCVCLSMLSLTSADVRTWWSLWTILAIGHACILPYIWIKAISAVFHANRGIAIAIALCGTGLCSALVPSLANHLVEQLGWRGAYIGLAAVGGVISFPLALALFRPVNETKGAPVPDRADVSVREGYRSGNFRKLAGIVGLYALAISILTTNLVPLLVASGRTAAAAAALAGLAGIGTIIGRLCCGLLLDRFNAARVGAMVVSLPVISVLLLLGFPASVSVLSIACLTIGLSAGGEFDSAAYIAAQHFGSRNLGALFGSLTGLMAFCAAIGPVLSNWVYDITGSYRLILWLEVPACVGVAALFLWLGVNPARQEQGRAGAAVG